MTPSDARLLVAFAVVALALWGLWYVLPLDDEGKSLVIAILAIGAMPLAAWLVGR